jgi:hypothetical protein
MPGKQAHYHLSHTSSPVFFFIIILNKHIWQGYRYQINIQNQVAFPHVSNKQCEKELRRQFYSTAPKKNKILRNKFNKRRARLVH